MSEGKSRFRRVRGSDGSSEYTIVAQNANIVLSVKLVAELLETDYGDRLGVVICINSTFDPDIPIIEPDHQMWDHIANQRLLTAFGGMQYESIGESSVGTRYAEGTFLYAMKAKTKARLTPKKLGRILAKEEFFECLYGFLVGAIYPDPEKASNTSGSEARILLDPCEFETALVEQLTSNSALYYEDEDREFVREALEGGDYFREPDTTNVIPLFGGRSPKRPAKT